MGVKNLARKGKKPVANRAVGNKPNRGFRPGRPSKDFNSRNVKPRNGGNFNNRLNNRNSGNNFRDKNDRQPIKKAPNGRAPPKKTVKFANDGDQDDGDNDEDDEQSSPVDAEKPSNLAIKKSRKEQRLKKKFDFEKNSRTVFVGNLPNNLDHREVEKLFKDCGPVESARVRCVVPEKEKLAPKVALITKRMHPKVDSVNAYVVFKTNENDECVKKALAMNGKVIDGHHIRVDRSVRPLVKKETLTSRKKSIFVGNLRFDIRDDDLFNHFSSVGPVNHVRIVRDRATGLGKGFGFVMFDDRASVKKALELDETNFKGRALRIKKIDKDTKDMKDTGGQANNKKKVETHDTKAKEATNYHKKNLKEKKKKINKRNIKKEDEDDDDE